MAKLLCKLDGGWEIRSDVNCFHLINKSKGTHWYFTNLETLLRDALNEGLKHHLKGTENLIPALDAAKDWVAQVANSIAEYRQGGQKRSKTEKTAIDKEEVLFA